MNTPVDGRRLGPGLGRRWLLACVGGELVGFIPPALVGGLLLLVGAPDSVAIVGLTLAGLLEGAALGAAQSAVLRVVLPDVRGWVVATTLGAGVAWFAGMAGSALAQTQGMLGVVVAFPGWMVGLCSLGLLQERQLRRAGYEEPSWWLVTTAAWCVGVAIPVVALSMMPNDWPIAAHVVSAIVAAVAMGATVGAVTGRALARLASASVGTKDPVHDRSASRTLQP